MWLSSPLYRQSYWVSEKLNNLSGVAWLVLHCQSLHQSFKTWEKWGQWHSINICWISNMTSGRHLPADGLLGGSTMREMAENICWILPSVGPSTRHFTNIPPNPHNNTLTEMVLSTFYRWINRSQPLLVVSPPGQLPPEMWPLELDLKQRGEETTTRKKPVRMCCSNPVPSGWVMKHVVDMNHFSAWQPPTSYVFLLYPNFLFGESPLCMALVRRETATCCITDAKEARASLLPSPVQPSQGGRRDLGSDWAKQMFAPRTPEHVRKAWDDWGSHFSQLCRWYAGQPTLAGDLRCYIYVAYLQETLEASHSSRLFFSFSVILWAQNSLLTNSFWFKINRAGFCCLQPRSLNGIDYG